LVNPSQALLDRAQALTTHSVTSINFGAARAPYATVRIKVEVQALVIPQGQEPIDAFARFDAYKEWREGIVLRPGGQ
jgi:hypothetical protein